MQYIYQQGDCNFKPLYFLNPFKFIFIKYNVNLWCHVSSELIWSKCERTFQSKINRITIHSKYKKETREKCKTSKLAKKAAILIMMQHASVTDVINNSSYPQHDCSIERDSKLSLTQQKVEQMICQYLFPPSLVYKSDPSVSWSYIGISFNK